MMKHKLLPLFILSILLITAVALRQPSTTVALSGSSFKAGNIISNSLFFRQPSMSLTSIQNFLNEQVPTCDTQGTQASGHSGYATRADWGTAHDAPPPYICLKDFHQNIPAKSAEFGLCNKMTARKNASAARIIYDISASCGIDVKVLIVLLQKEQSLITDDWPWPIQYRSATGYGCHGLSGVVCRGTGGGVSKKV